MRTAALVALALLAGVARAQSEVILDNGSPQFAISGTWPASSSVAGYYGTNYQTHEPNGAPPGSVMVDNTSAGFSVTGSWPNSTAVAGYVGTNYQVHGANGEPPTAIVADNSSGTPSGTWPTSTSVSGYYGTNYQMHPAGTGTDSFAWTLNVASAGTYEVYARWTASTNRASNAKYTVTHAAGQDTVVMNQQANSATWQLLGTYSFDAGSTTISLSDDANGYVIADAVMIAPPGAGPNTATWTPNVAQAGTYEVYARWTASTNRATDATYTVTHSGGQTAVTANQQANGGAWNLLGTFSLSPGTTYNITLTDQANGYVIADAIRLVPVAVQAQQKLYFIEVDHLDTPRLIADSTGTMVWRNDNSEPFGDSVPDENPSGLGAFVFALRDDGTYADTETNLVYNWSRYRDASGGRFLQADLLGVRSRDLSLYVLRRNNPLTYTDPDGLEVALHCRPVVGTFGRYTHCFVHASCPSEGIDEVLSLFGKFPYGIAGLPATGYKSSSSSMEGGNMRDDPNSPANVYNKMITPQKPNCNCEYEKSVISRFYNAPATQPYGGTGSNSNTFAQDLITSPSFGTSWPSDAPSNAVGTLPIRAGRIQ